MADELKEISAPPEMQEARAQRPPRARLTEEETLRRMESFDERKRQIVAAVRRARDRGVTS
jgi:hypothetical protein